MGNHYRSKEEELFSNKFPKLNFSNLELMSKQLRDATIRYIDIKTKIIYGYCLVTKNWKILKN